MAMNRLRNVSLIALLVSGCSSEPEALTPEYASPGSTAASATPPDASSDASQDVIAPTPDAGVADADPTLLHDGGSKFPHPLTGTADPTLVTTGLVFAEGPLWLPSTGQLLFSDITADKTYLLVPGGTPTVHHDPSNHANGHALAPSGIVYTCEQGAGAGRLTRTLANGAVEVVVSMFGGLPLNSANDVIVRSDGNVYFTDPNFTGNSQPKQNVFRLAPMTAAPTVVDDTLQKPNGIALSPSEDTLYVASYAGDFINKYPIAADGSTGAGSRFVSGLTKPDGITTDDAGNVYAAVASGIAVYRRDGTLLGTITIPNGKRASNMSFGDADRRTLYITAQTDIYKVKLNVAGRP